MLRNGKVTRALQGLQTLENDVTELRKLLRDVRKAQARLEKTLNPRQLVGRLHRVEQGVEAILREQMLGPAALDLPYPERLTTRRFRLWSQNGEDGITLALLLEAGIATRRFVELGCGTNGGNSGFLCNELGWDGLMVDGSAANVEVLNAQLPPGRVKVVEAWLTADSVDALIREHGFSGEVDVLSIDIDGNDYWLWERITSISPRIVIVEYNSAFGPDRAVVVPYDPGFERCSVEGGAGLYYGASLAALTELGKRLGYRLICIEPRGVNAYFLRNDVAPHVPAVEPAAVYRLLEKYVRAQSEGRGVWALVAEHDLPLVDVAAAS
jgi:hypothetical protein